jgi:benzylsuccinate CoA-transferase BbsF subunit
MDLLGYGEEEPRPSLIAYPDAVAGVSGAVLALAALYHARSTGEGQWIDLSQMEATIAMLGEVYLARQETGVRPPRAANRHASWAPHGTYPCHGDDAWVSLAARSDEEWRALCRVIGRPDLAADPSLAEAAGRLSAGARLDEAIAAWTSSRSKLEAMGALQVAGVPAGAILDAGEVLSDPQMGHAGFFQQARREGRPPDTVPGSPILVDGVRPEARAAPLPGEDGLEVLTRVLGLSPAQVDALAASGALYRPKT